MCARTRARPVRPARTWRHGRHADGTRGLFGGLAGGRVHARRANGWDCCHRRRRGGRRGRRHCDCAPHFRARPHARRGERGFCGFDLAEGQQQALSHRAALPRLMVESPRHEPEHHASGGAAVLAEAPAVVGRGQSASKRARAGGGGGGGASPHTPVASRCRADGSRTLRCDGMPCHRRTHSSRAPSPLSLSLSLLRAPARLPPAPAAQRQTEEAEANDTEPPPLPPFPDVTAILPVVTKVVLREWTTVTLRRVFERVAERILRPELAWKLTKVRALVRCVGVGTAVRPACATRDCSDAVSPRRTSAHQPCARRRALAAGVA